MDSDKGPVVFPLLTLGRFSTLKFSLLFCDYLLGILFFLGAFLLTPNRLNQQGKIFSLVFISQHCLCVFSFQSRHSDAFTIV